MPAYKRIEHCEIRFCDNMKDVIMHIQDCKDRKKCKIPHCFSTRLILSHVTDCAIPSCLRCEPLCNNRCFSSTKSERLSNLCRIKKYHLKSVCSNYPMVSEIDNRLLGTAVKTEIRIDLFNIFP
ncbi:hypothetical protein A3Q56_00407 [Intoshia linei]|uniref:TAZ-type domain-containing protein n=1 Tax=Intoshia linei TaxID=1819745 RepID=A0A177BBS9_9BILA|nr:hypothetical protein A3Q56_00407 [Intoshia linei]